MTRDGIYQEGKTQCPPCGQWLCLRKDLRLPKHRHWIIARGYCPGGGKSPRMAREGMGVAELDRQRAKGRRISGKGGL